MTKNEEKEEDPVNSEDNNIDKLQEMYVNNGKKTAFGTLQLIDFQMCDLVTDDAMIQLKNWYPDIRIYNYYKEEIF